MYAIQADPRQFSSSIPCAVCDVSGHSFDECPILKDIAFLIKHHIQYCLTQRRLKKMTTTCVAVNAVHAAITDEETEDLEARTNDPNQDFHSGEQ